MPLTLCTQKIPRCDDYVVTINSLCIHVRYAATIPDFDNSDNFCRGRNVSFVVIRCHFVVRSSEGSKSMAGLEISNGAEHLSSVSGGPLGGAAGKQF